MATAHSRMPAIIHGIGTLRAHSKISQLQVSTGMKMMSW